MLIHNDRHDQGNITYSLRGRSRLLTNTGMCYSYTNLNINLLQSDSTVSLKKNAVIVTVFHAEPMKH